MSSAFRRRRQRPKAADQAGDINESDGRRPQDGGLKFQRLPLSLPGVKPWTGGIHLTSTGLNDLDAMLGGGQPLGTCVLLLEDRWCCDLARCFVRYWCAEAISQGQTLRVPVHEEQDETEPPEVDLSGVQQGYQSNEQDVRDMLNTLPRNLHWDKDAARQNALQNTSQGAEAVPSLVNEGLGVLAEDTEEAEDDLGQGELMGDEGLNNAWQYRKSVQKARMTHSSNPNKSLASGKAGNNTRYCHSYNLSGRMSEQTEVFPADMFFKIDSYTSPLSAADPTCNSAISLYRDLISVIAKHTSAASSSEPGDSGQDRERCAAVRLLLYHLPIGDLAVAVPLVLAYIRQHKLPVVMMVCATPTTVRDTPSTSVWLSLQRSVDVVLRAEGFASRAEYPPPAEFRHLQGILTVKKANTITAATANGGGHFADLTTDKRPAAYVYGLKRDRRKLYIPLLHIPPEDYAEGGGSVGSGGVRSGAGRPSNSSGMGCASNMEGSALDF